MTVPAASSDAPAIACPNCGATIEARFKHCTACGAIAHPQRLTMRMVWETFLEHFLEMDSPLLRTFINLWRTPGRVASEYLAGKRKAYTNPLKYNLITAVVIMAMVHIVTSRMQTQGIQSAQPASNANPVSRLIVDGMAVSQQWHSDYLQIIYILTLPAFALMLRGFLGRRSNRNATEFYVMSLYAFGQIYLFQAACLAIILISPWPWMMTAMGLVSGLSPFVYVPWMTIGFTGIGAWRAGLWSLLAFFLFSTAIGITMMGAGITYIAITRGMI